MTFTSLEFLVLLGVTFVLYWCLERRAQNLLLLVVNSVFYAWWNWHYLPLIVLSASADYAAGIALDSVDAPRTRRLILGAALGFNLAILCYFKYAGFLYDSAYSLGALVGFNIRPRWFEILLPIGISFHTFQSMSYSIDVYRRELKPTRNYLEFVSFVTFFPQLVAGPIERAHRLLSQFQAPRVFSGEAARDGLRRMLWGYFKKLVIADNISWIVKNTYTHLPQSNGGTVAAASMLFSIQLYCDFSAYSDIGTGAARLLGFDLMRNFAYPFFATSCAEFWRRWHMSLTGWFRDYVYHPLGGSRVPPGTRMCNMLIVFLISGLWHGANWTFVMWGIFVGLSVILFSGNTRPDAVPLAGRILPRPMELLRIIISFILFSASMTMFVAPNAASVWMAWFKICTDWDGPAFLATLSPHLVGIGILFAAEWTQREYLHPLQIAGLPVALRWGIYTAVCVAILVFGALNYNEPFIYFQF